MASRNTDMQAIFSELSEKNKDIVILIAKSVKVAQEVAEQPRNPPPHADDPVIEVDHCSIGAMV